jgi:hypothetical protein
VLLLGYYITQLGQRWPTWSVIAKGGLKPPASFCRDLEGPDVPFRLGDAPAAPAEP